MLTRQSSLTQWSGKPFRIPTLTEWWIIITEEKLVDELQNVPEHILSTSPLGEVGGLERGQKQSH